MYDSLNRLTNLVWKCNSTNLASFAYQLKPGGTRVNLLETNGAGANGLNYAWSYDNLYRLASEAIGGQSVSYGYDAVGNRTNRISTVTGLRGDAFYSYDTNDELTADANLGNYTFDADGSTTYAPNSAGGSAYTYDGLDRLITFGSGTSVVYDGDGNRVGKGAFNGNNWAGTIYLVDDRNPSGYPQVLEEYTFTNSITTLTRTYNWGLGLISQQQFDPVTLFPSTLSYYGYDGHGSVRFLMSTNATVTDTYTYDAYGSLINQTGSRTPNNYLYCGQLWDPDLGLYYNRARYLNTDLGRFWSLDSYAGDQEDPLSLHKYLYGWDNPINETDPTGRWITVLHKMAIRNVLKGLVTDSDMETLCEMQDKVDAKANQDAAHAYMHAMRDGTHGQTVEQAKEKSNNWIRELLNDAQKDESGGHHDLAMQELGQAIHPLQDSTSPAHHGFQPWFDYPGGEANPHEWCHGAKEAIYPGTGSCLETATLQAYNYYKGIDPMPSDFFNNLGADSVGSEFNHWFQLPMDIDPDVNLSFTIGDIGGFAF